MADVMSELSDDFIKQLLAKPETTRNTAKKLDLTKPDNRDIMVWIKLYHTFGLCSNPGCPDERPQKVAEGKAMCTDVAGVLVCRLCFLAGFALDKPEGGL
jgi:acyl-CoA synthetase (AMP-forming)/AMP-acid ligase II